MPTFASGHTGWRIISKYFCQVKQPKGKKKTKSIRFGQDEVIFSIFNFSDAMARGPLAVALFATVAISVVQPSLKSGAVTLTHVSCVMYFDFEYFQYFFNFFNIFNMFEYYQNYRISQVRWLRLEWLALKYFRYYVLGDPKVWQNAIDGFASLCGDVALPA